MKMLKLFAIVLLFIASDECIAQSDTVTATSLEEIIIKAYGNKSRLQTAAAVHVLNRYAFERNAGTSAVGAISSVPGVTMEERSPGSYRINIRGSSLRSPFGVRNVKVYYNDIPLTDAAGTTYLNALGVHNFQSLEIVKGPGSSMYGAGTGGVMLIEGVDTATSQKASAAYSYGSFHQHHAYAAVKASNHTISYEHLQADGYREHSALQRNVVSYTGILFNRTNQQLRMSVLYSNLRYETPGGLTFSEFNINARQSRPAAGTFPSAKAAKAGIHQNNLLTGLSYRSTLSRHLSQQSVLYAAHNSFDNPAIRNYGNNIEPHFGGRTQWTFTKKLNRATWQTDAGGELQQNLNRIRVYTNNGGEPGTLQTADKVDTRQYFVFVQQQFSWRRWIITGGASLNRMGVTFRPLVPSGAVKQTATFSNGLAPRISLLRKMTESISVYAAVEKGFSPPASSELLPSGSPLNLALRAESGWNRQFGLRGYLYKHLYADINIFSLSLNNTIVQRRDAGGGEYFINGGSTNQHGFESYLSYQLFTKSAFINKSMFWFSYTWHSFRYLEFRQINTDYSGNRLPGSAPITAAAGLDLVLRNQLSAHLTWTFNDKIFLNDANSATAASYHLLGLKVGYVLRNLKPNILLNMGTDNLLNATYSNGNDINAAGGRYYNVAAGRNFWIQLRFDLITKQI